MTLVADETIEVAIVEKMLERNQQQDMMRGTPPSRRRSSSPPSTAGATGDQPAEPRRGRR